jgi:DNA polymerase-3 subunit gamma/tau
MATQEHVSDTLRTAVARGRVAHAYLFAGPRGVGKTTAARVLAMALNCPDRTPEGEPERVFVALIEIVLIGAGAFFLVRG